MSLNKEQEIILGELKYHAFIFLNEFDEFYPFGGYLNQKGEYVPLQHYSGEEFPDIIEKRNSLIEHLEKTLNEGGANIVGICTNVYFEYEHEKFDSLEMDIWNKNGRITLEVLYKKNNSYHELKTILTKEISNSEP